MNVIRVLALLTSLSAGWAQPPPPASPVPSPPSAPVVVTPDYINQLFDGIRATHPLLRAADARTAEAREGVTAVRRWQDPLFQIGGAIAADNGPMLEQEGDLFYRLEQKLPVFGLPTLEREQATGAAAGAALQADFQTQSLRRSLAVQLFQAAWLNRQIALTQDDLAWIDRLLADATERVRTARGSTVDALRTQNERDRRVTLLQTQTNALAAALARLNRWLNRDPALAWPTLELPPLMGPIPYSERLVTLALAHEPRLQILRQETRVADTSVRLAHRRRLPEVMAGIQGRQYSGDGGFREGMFMMGLSLPWFNQSRYRADRRREESRRTALTAEVADLELEVREEVLRLTAELDSARREAILYRDTILPRTRQVLDTLRHQWLNGTASLTDLLQTRRELIESEQMFARAVAEQYERLAELVLCCGLGDLGALEQLGFTHDPLP